MAAHRALGAFYFLVLWHLGSTESSHRHHWWQSREEGHDLGLGDYVLTHDYNSTNLLEEFRFMTAADYPGTGDPTKGFVNYVDAATASSQGLTKILGGKLFLGVDNKTVLETSMQGRSSLRLESKRTWSSGLLVADVAHMPGSECGVWPALYARYPYLHPERGGVT